VKIYTRRGDDGSTGLFHGGRVPKDDTGPEAYGAVDEAVAALGTARALSSGDTAAAILEVQRSLFVVGAELATAPEHRDKLVDGQSRATRSMVDELEGRIDEIEARVGMPSEFVVPGGTAVAGALDVARTVVRRAERRAVSHLRASNIEDSQVVRYLNRLADYLYMLARSEESAWEPSRTDDSKETST